MDARCDKNVYFGSNIQLSKKERDVNHYALQIQKKKIELHDK